MNRVSACNWRISRRKRQKRSAAGERWTSDTGTHTGAKGRPRGGSSLSRGRDRFVVFRIRHSYAFYAGAGDKRQILIRIQRTWNLSPGEESRVLRGCRANTVCDPVLFLFLFFILSFFFFFLNDQTGKGEFSTCFTRVQ